MSEQVPLTSNDISAHVQAMQAQAEAELASPANPDDARPEGSSMDLERQSWPALSSPAFHGLPGAIVRTIEPHTEADNAALLVQLLSGFGSLIGKTAHFRVGGDFHHTKLFAVLVGETSSGRKGTSWSEIERILVHVDPTFQGVVQNGLSSGEGLIYHVRDEVTKLASANGRGSIICQQTVITDEGAKEKRAFVIEPEFARVLKVMTRDGNTLSSVIRQSWDTDRLSVMTKTPLKATNAHITIVGHITETELVRNLQETEIANGFANRFLWVCVRRSKYLPDGGDLHDSDLNDVVFRLQKAVQFALTAGELRRDQKASELWRKAYRILSDGYRGLLGSVTSRATAQVMRLASIYALLDCSEIICREHLKAALAVWLYCEDSAKYLFGMSTADKLTTRIVRALLDRPEGMTKTEIFEVCGRNYSARTIDGVISPLIQLGRVEMLKERTEGKAGRPPEIFRLRSHEKNEQNEENLFGGN